MNDEEKKLLEEITILRHRNAELEVQAAECRPSDWPRQTHG